MNKLVIVCLLFLMGACSGITFQPSVVTKNSIILKEKPKKILILVDDEYQKSSLILSERLQFLARNQKMQVFPPDEYKALKLTLNQKYAPLFNPLNGQPHQNNLSNRNKDLTETLITQYGVDLVIKVHIIKDSARVINGYVTWGNMRQYKTSDLSTFTLYDSVYSVKLAYSSLTNNDIKYKTLGLSAADDLYKELSEKIDNYDSVLINMLQPAITR